MFIHNHMLIRIDSPIYFRMDWFSFASLPSFDRSIVLPRKTRLLFESHQSYLNESLSLGMYLIVHDEIFRLYHEKYSLLHWYVRFPSRAKNISTKRLTTKDMSEVMYETSEIIAEKSPAKQINMPESVNVFFFTSRFAFLSCSCLCIYRLNQWCFGAQAKLAELNLIFSKRRIDVSHPIARVSCP